MKIKRLFLILFLTMYSSYSQDRKTENSILYELIENPPLAPKCKAKWSFEKIRKCTSEFVQNHIQENFNAALGSDLGLTGRIRIDIEFVIDKHGIPCSITATGGPEKLNQHAIDVIKKLPRFIPGSTDGKAVNVLYALPLVFFIQ